MVLNPKNNIKQSSKSKVEKTHQCHIPWDEDGTSNLPGAAKQEAESPSFSESRQSRGSKLSDNFRSSASKRRHLGRTEHLGGKDGKRWEKYTNVVLKHVIHVMFLIKNIAI